MNTTTTHANTDAALNSRQLRSLLDDLNASELKSVLLQIETKLDSIHFNQSQIIINTDDLLKYFDNIILNSPVFYTFYVSLHGASINIKEIRGASKEKFRIRKEAEAQALKEIHHQEILDAIQLNWFQRLIYVFNREYIFRMIKNNKIQ